MLPNCCRHIASFSSGSWKLMHKAPTLRFSLIKLRIFSRPNYKYSILSINTRSCRCMNKCVRQTFKKKRRSDDDAGRGFGTSNPPQIYMFWLPKERFFWETTVFLVRWKLLYQIYKEFS